MSIEDVKEALAAIQVAHIPNIGRAYSRAPESLPPGDLPAFVNLAGPSTIDWNTIGSDNGVETREYRMRLYVAPLGQGISGEKEEKVETFITPTREAFSSRPSLGGVVGVMNVFFQGDTGPVAMEYGSDEFIGVIFKISVVEYVPRTYEVRE